MIGLATSVLLALTLAVPPPQSSPGSKLKLQSGDRVVFLGGTFVERGQEYGYLESMLTAANPTADVEFRNLGWSGDTVFGHARAGFGTVADGFERLKEHVAAIKPTVVLIAYGANESFEGEAGLSSFREGFNRLLDVVEAGKPRQIVLIAPTPMEDLGRPLPNPSAHNRDLSLYRDAIGEIAASRQHGFVDLFAVLQERLGRKVPHLTDNGLHYTELGYRVVDGYLAELLGSPRPVWSVALQEGRPSAEGAALADVSVGQRAASFRATDLAFPLPPLPDGWPAEEQRARTLSVAGLEPGDYTLSIDGKPVTTADASAWAKGVPLSRGPELDRAESLRRAIIAKNRLYFYRWRPQNETYLFGFRKHEQGNNAREVPLFDPLVAEKEAEIARLRVHSAHHYELNRQEKEVGR